MIFQIGPKHVRIDNFHGEIGSFSYYVLGDLVQIYAATGDVFYVYYRDVTDPVTGTAFATLNAFIAYLDANFFKSGDGSGGGGTTYAGVSPTARYLFTSANQTSLDWESRQLLTGSGTKSLDWGMRGLYNSTGIKTVDYETPVISDAYGYSSANFTTRLLLHQNGNRAVFWDDGRNSMHDVYGLIGVIWGNTRAFVPNYSFDYAQRTLVDGTFWSGRGAVALDWSNRYLVDSNESIVARWNERILTHNWTDSINWASRNLLDTNGQYSVNWGERFLMHGGLQSLNWANRELLSSGAKSVDWGARGLYNSTGIKTVDYETPLIADASGYGSANFTTRLLLHQNGTRAIFWDDGRNTMHDINGLVGVIWGNTRAFVPSYTSEYGQRTLVDGTYWSGRGAVSLDWSNRYLVDSNETIVGKWNERLLVHNGQDSINWASRNLFDTNGQYSVNWSERFLMHGGLQCLNWANRQLLDNSGFVSHSWLNRSLHDTNGVAGIEYGSRFLNDGYGSPAVDWHNRALMTVSGAATLIWGQSQSGSGAEVLRFTGGTRIEFDAATLNDDTTFANSGGVQTGTEMLNYYGINGARYLATPKRWARIDGSDNQQYYLPLY